MSSKKEHESMENLERCYKIVQQSSAKGGISAIEIGKKLGIHRTTVHKHLSSLELMGKVERKQGIWIAKTGEQTIKPLEKEIIIELPLPEDRWADEARLQIHADYLERNGLASIAKMEKTFIEKYTETRRIRIIGKNVDDIDLEKIGNLIQQANEKSSKLNFKRFLNKIKIPQFPKEEKKNQENSNKEQEK